MTPGTDAGGIDRSSVWMLGGAISFASMGALVHALGDRCDWLVVALIRALMMFVTASILAKASGSKLAVWRPRTLWLRSLAGSFSLVCNFYALARLPVADAVTLMNVHPLWIVLISAIAIRRPPSIGEVVGVFSGLIGVVLIEQPHVGVDRLAALVALLSSVSTAIAMLGLHKLRHLDPRAVVAHFAGVASLISAIWLILRRETLSPGLMEPITMLLLLGVGISGTLGQVFLTKAYAAGAPAKVAVVGLTQVVFAMGFDVGLWGRPLTPTALAGFALVMAPTTWLSLRAAKKLSTTVRPEPLPIPKSAEVP
ncbi:DMT family transporter [Tundrisphaera lichenicola]|uniref:DMT family transporter n=1 Tax=Tundrisphaera lichenicola TaxID=2029860 RepID=UPI003EC0803B